MLSLHELQSSLKHAVLAGGDNGPHLLPGLVDARSSSRLQIYRNNTLISLTEALKTTFPVTVEIVHERFFRYLAASFIRAHPPKEPQLSAYGAQLPSFIASFEPCNSLPYLPDVARLEWLANEAIHAVEQAPLGAASLASLDPQTLMSRRVTLQPSLRLLASRYPILAIWQGHQPGARDAPSCARRGLDRLAIRRRGTGLSISALACGQSRLLYDLSAGLTIGVALERALVRDRSFDPARELLAIFAHGLATGIEANVSPQPNGVAP